MLHRAEREQVVAACRRLSSEKLVVGTAGNVSIRVGDQVVISPSGLDYGLMSPRHVGVHDLTGAAVEAELDPSSELPLHLAIYAAYGHTAVIHTHSVASTALSVVLTEIPTTHYYSALFGGAIRVAPYATFGSDALATNVVAALADRSAALMANHGAVLVGERLSAVLSQVDYLEYLCEVQQRVAAHGGRPSVLSPDEIDRVGRALTGYGQQPTD